MNWVIKENGTEAVCLETGARLELDHRGCLMVQPLPGKAYKTRLSEECFDGKPDGVEAFIYLTWSLKVHLLKAEKDRPDTFEKWRTWIYKKHNALREGYSLEPIEMADSYK